jgi:NADPH2:quinone reductase
MPWSGKKSPTPEPGPGEVRVAIKAASLNFPDLLIVQGKYQMKPPLPFVPGAEFAGVVEAVGEGVKHLSVGTTWPVLPARVALALTPWPRPRPC